MSSKALVTVLGEDREPVSRWQKILSFLPIEKNGKKYTVKPAVIFVTVGILVVVVAIVHMVLDEDRPNAVSSISTPDSLVNPSLSQTVNVPESTGSGSKVAVNPQRGTRSGGGNRRFQYSGPQVIARPKDLGNIPPGSMLWAKLVTGASNGLVRAEVTEGLSVNGDPKIPAGTVLVGAGSSTEERLFVHFTEAVFKDGTMGTINAEACDGSDKIVGLKGSKVGNKALNIAGSIGLGFVGGFSEGLQETQGQQGAVIRTPSLKNALLNATATTALDQSKELMLDLKNRTPIIEIPESTRVCVIFSGGNQ